MVAAKYFIVMAALVAAIPYTRLCHKLIVIPDGA
jgi:hypothetical protein